MQIVREGFHIFYKVTCEITAYYLKTEYPMLSYNKPSVFLPIQIREENGEQSIYYDITGKQSLASWGQNHSLRYEECQTIVHGLYELFLSVEDYMLSIDQVSMDKEEIFYSSDGKLQWIYTPFSGKIAKEGLENLFLWILSVVDYRDKKALNLVYTIFHSLKTEGFRKETLEKIQYGSSIQEEEASILLSGEKQSSTGFLPEEEAREEGGMNPQIVEPVRKKKRKKKTFFRQAGFLLISFLLILSFSTIGFWIYEKGVNFPSGLLVLLNILLFVILQKKYLSSKEISRVEDSVERICGSEDRMGKEKYMEKENVFEDLEKYWNCQDSSIILSRPEVTQQARLKPFAGGDEIRIQVFPFYIGSEEGLNQLTLKDKAISRQHAVISKGRDGNYLIEDLESKHGTWVDGVRIRPSQAVALSSQNIIVFGKESWVFTSQKD